MKDTGLSLRKAAAAYGVPVATLGRKNHLDPEKTKIKTGPETVSLKEEDDIVKLIKENTEFPVVVYMDNYSSHLSLPLVTFW